MLLTAAVHNNVENYSFCQPSYSENILRPAHIDIPVALPFLPTANHITPYIQQIDENHWYSNQGPLCERLQERLGQFWGVGHNRVALVANATTGLSLALQAHNIPAGKRCLMPSWTFVASAAAVTNANLRPHFVDICPSSWCPDPAQIEELAKEDDVGAILIVAPFGAPLDLALWDSIADRTGLPVIIDAAAAFDTLRLAGPMRPGRSTVVISLHATKVYGVGEGGAVITDDPALAEHIRILARFGFAGSRSAQYQAINAKISEYTAAVGLASLDCWEATRSRWSRITEIYKKSIPPAFTLSPAFGNNWVSSTLTVLCPTKAEPVREYLAAHGTQTISWWGTGCHTQPAYSSCTQEPLPVTKEYGLRSIGLPFWQHLSEEKILHICMLLNESLK